MDGQLNRGEQVVVSMVRLAISISMFEHLHVYVYVSVSTHVWP